MKNLFQLYDQLKVSKNSLINLTNKLGENYSKKIQPKKKFGRIQENEICCKIRHIEAPCEPLKAIQRKICRQLEKIDLPDCMYGAVKGKNNILNALQHIENKFFLTIDLKNFFSRINNERVIRIFIENGYCWQVSRILTKLTTYQYRLPQGAVTSPIIANLAFKETALQLMKVAKEKNIIFTVYLDDLTFSSKQDFRDMQPLLLKIIRDNHFFPNKEKIHYYINKCDVTGLFIGNGQLEIDDQMLEAAKTNEFVRSYIKHVQKSYEEYNLKFHRKKYFSI